MFQFKYTLITSSPTLSKDLINNCPLCGCESNYLHSIPADFFDKKQITQDEITEDNIPIG